MKQVFTRLVLLAWPVLGLAQTVQQEAATAATPELPVPAVSYRPLEPAGASALVQELEDWKAANAAVGQYPRGHRDIIKWERAQQAVQPAPPQEPAR